MGDIDVRPTKGQELYWIASEQHGFFTAAQARSCGYTWDLLSHHTKTGRFQRWRRGLYRLRDYPDTPKDEVAAAWIAVGKEKAVVSHTSALDLLDLLDLSDIIPDAVHLTVPRSTRNLPKIAGVKIHTTVKPPKREEITHREGIALTDAPRAILDSAEMGAGPEQIEMAVRQALRRWPWTKRELERESLAYRPYVQQLINRSIELSTL